MRSTSGGRYVTIGCMVKIRSSDSAAGCLPNARQSGPGREESARAPLRYGHGVRLHALGKGGTSEARGFEVKGEFHGSNLASHAKSRQATFEPLALTESVRLRQVKDMRKLRRAARQLPHLRAWRNSLGLSRQVVVDKLALLDGGPPRDQAALAKWESGESAVRVEDLMLLAEVYGTTADRLFFPPGDAGTPAAMQAAYEIITSRDPEAVRRWLAMGESLAPAADDENDVT